MHFEAAEVGLTHAGPADLAGGDARANAELLDRLLAGSAPQGLVDSIILNAAAALHVVGRARSITDGIGTARDLLLGGAVAAWLEKAKQFGRP
jgi:anthranilate phosphoribosyltransferase